MHRRLLLACRGPSSRNAVPSWRPPSLTSSLAHPLIQYTRLFLKLTSSLGCLLLETEQGSGLSLCLLMTSLPQECPVQSFAYAGPWQPDLQPGSQPSMSASERLPRPHLPPHKIPHTSSGSLSPPPPCRSAQLCSPGRCKAWGLSLHSQPESPTHQLPLFLTRHGHHRFSATSARHVGLTHSPEGQSWTQGTGSWQLAR